MLKGSMCLLLLGMVTLALGSAAGGQTLPLLPGVKVSPAILTAPGPVEVTVPGFEGAQGCRFGKILAGESISNAKVLLVGDFDNADTFSTSTFYPNVPFESGKYSIFVSCTDERSELTEYSTDQTLTILDSATTTTTTPPVPPSTTTLAPPPVDGEVNPTTIVPGKTEIVVRGGGFKVDATLQITLDSKPPTVLGTTTAKAGGFYAASLTPPATTPPGKRNVLVTGPAPDDTPRTTRVPVTVVDLDCRDFNPTTGAQAAMGPGTADPHGLDANKDGIACNGGATRTAAGGAAAPAAPAEPSGTLPATGSERSELGIMVGLTALTLGALLIGFSHPAEPASGYRRGRHRHRRR